MPYNNILLMIKETLEGGFSKKMCIAKYIKIRLA